MLIRLGLRLWPSRYLQLFPLRWALNSRESVFNTHEAGEAVDGFEASSRLRKSPNSRTTNHGRFDEALY
jgi:hypothetical protein